MIDTVQGIKDWLFGELVLPAQIMNREQAVQFWEEALEAHSQPQNVFLGKVYKFVVYASPYLDKKINFNKLSGVEDESILGGEERSKGQGSGESNI